MPDDILSFDDNVRYHVEKFVEDIADDMLQNNEILVNEKIYYIEIEPSLMERFIGR